MTEAYGGQEHLSGIPVTMLLLGDPAHDIRVIKVTRSLQAAGYQVHLYCMAHYDSGQPLPDLGGAVVQWVAASRPIHVLHTAVSKIRTVLSRAPRRSLQHAARENEERSSVQHNAVPAQPKLWRELRALAGTLWLNVILARHARNRSASMIHAHDLDTLFAGVLLRRWCKAALVYDTHELYPEMQATSSALYSGLWRILEHWLITHATAVITVNESIAQELERRHRRPHRPTVVMNCPPLQRNDEQTSGSEDQEKSASASASTPTLVYHGRLQEERGVDVVIQALPLVPSEVQFMVRGSGPAQQALEQRAEAYGVRNRVHFLPLLPPDQLVAALPAGSIGLVPYLPTCLNNYYCTPNKVFEYLMGGLIVLASDLPELKKIVHDTGAGLLYTATDPRELAHAINTLLANSEARAQHMRAAYRAAREQFNWEAQEKKLWYLYHNALLREA